MLSALSNIQAINPYVPGKPMDELRRELGLTTVIKLASNENPLGMSPKAKAAMMAEASESSRYPDGNGFHLKTAIAAHYQALGLNVNTAQLVLGNGSNDVLDLATRIFLAPNTHAVMSEYAFAVYPLVVQACAAHAVVVPTKNFQQDLPAMTAAVRRHHAKVVFLANPNNPTGVWTPMAEVKAWIESIPDDCAVILDEAYTEFLPVDNPRDANISLTWLAEHPNLIITRTFSKIYGLGGLRVGYALAQPNVADWMNRLRQPFNVSNLALAAAVAALGDEGFVAQSRANNLAQMLVLEKGLHDLGLTTIPSRCNFIMFQVADGARVNRALLQLGVIVRPLASYGLPNHLRVTIGLPEENQIFLRSLAKVLRAP